MGAVNTYWFNVAKAALAGQTYNLVTNAAFKIMLIKSGAASDTVLLGANGGENLANCGSLTALEIVATNYTGGFAGAGRKAVPATKSWAVSQTDDWAQFVTNVGDPQLTWTALGGAVNDTVGYVVGLIEVTNDAGSVPIFCAKLTTAVPTNGGDFKLSWGASGIMMELQNPTA